jgi:cellulose synthase/poly-beta-1,6-N-acetylglucosamine synthase-like glycosyltransferase
MISLVSVLLLAVAVPLAAAAAVLLVELTTAMVTRPAAFSCNAKRPSVVVLIPAHNEGPSILPTLRDIKPQLRLGDRLLVVADNCSDRTAEIAEVAGADVVRRNDPERYGKGFALDFGFRSLTATDPEVVIVIDADCRLDSNAIDLLARTCRETQRPVQALYLMNAPKGALIQHQISEFAWRIKNDLRPRGLMAFGLPCQLMGSGMAFPRSAIDRIELASGHLAEDLEIGLQLAASGYAPRFCPTARVRSEFATTQEASLSQRQRWEHGHLSILAKSIIPYIWSAAFNRDGRLLVLSLDAAVPPLALLGFLILATFSASGLVWNLGGGVAPLLVSGSALAFLMLGLVLAWIKCGRDLITLKTLFSVVPYIASKFGIYARAFASNKKWERTDRSKSERKN